MFDYISSGNLIPNYQFGFKAQHSTSHQLLRLTEQAFQNKNNVIAIFPDVQKAFDRVWHTGLIYKLFQMGFPIYLIQLLRSFLTDRTFVTRIGSTTSEIKPILAGTPQESSLSPILYNLYTADFPTNSQVQIAMYADDTVLFTASSDILIAADSLQNILNEISSWSSNWRIRLNSQKCIVKLFSMRKCTIFPLLSLNNENLNWLPDKESVKYLGVYLDRRLNWNAHIKNKIKQANRRFYK